MGTLIAVYLLCALALALLYTYSVLYSAMYRKLPFGMQNAEALASAERMNDATNDIVVVAGVNLGTALVLVSILICAVWVGICWPVWLYETYKDWGKK